MNDWIEKIWHVIGMLLVLAVAGWCLMWMFSTKRVDGYYFSHVANQSSATCIMAHWTWNADQPAFCTNDYQQAIDFVTKANATVKP